ncbi:MAG: acyl carrier protein [Clostridiales bacterium]
MVFEKIREIIANKLDIDVVTITPETSFDDMKIDSLYMVEIMLSIEEAFDITIDQADGMEKVADIVAYVENKLQK